MLSPDLISGVSFWVFKALWENRNEAYKLLSQHLKQRIFYASKEYQANYIARHGFTKQEEFMPSIDLSEIYVASSLIDQTTPAYPLSAKLAHYKEIDYLENLNFTHDGIEIANRHPKLIVSGESGVGKSTLLQKIGIEAFKSSQENLQNAHIPVFIKASECFNEEVDLVKVIDEEFERCGFPEHLDFVESALEKGNILLLIDELDTIPTSAQDDAISKISVFSNLYKNNRIILARQSLEKSENLVGFHRISLLGFSSRQAQSYIQKIYPIHHEDEISTVDCQILWQQIGEQSQTTKSIVHNPFCLNIVIALYQPTEHKFSGKTILYEKILFKMLNADIYSGTQKELIQGINNSLDTKLKILSEIAYICLKSGRVYFQEMEINRLYYAVVRRIFSYDNIAFMSSDREALLDGFITHSGKSMYRFNNLLIQKILVAYYLINNLKQLDGAIEQFLDTPEWKDVFIFLAGLQGTDYLLSVIQSCMVSKPSASYLIVFFGWIKDVSKDVCISHHPAVNRCYCVFTFFEIMLLFGDRGYEKDLISKILRQVHEIISLLDPSCKVLGLPDLERKNNPVFNTKYLIDPKIVRGLSIESLLELAENLSRKASVCKLFSPAQSRRMAHTIARLKEQLTGKKISTYHRKVCTSNLYRLWMEALKVSDFSLDITTDDMNFIYLYCQRSCLIVRCLKETFYVSGKRRGEIIDTLFSNLAFVDFLQVK